MTIQTLIDRCLENEEALRELAPDVAEQVGEAGAAIESAGRVLGIARGLLEDRRDCARVGDAKGREREEKKAS